VQPCQLILSGFHYSCLSRHFISPTAFSVPSPGLPPSSQAHLRHNQQQTPSSHAHPIHTSRTPFLFHRQPRAVTPIFFANGSRLPSLAKHLVFHPDFPCLANTSIAIPCAQADLLLKMIRDSPFPPTPVAHRIRLGAGKRQRLLCLPRD